MANVGLLAGVAGFAGAAGSVAEKAIERRDTDIRDDALNRKTRSIAELQSRLVAGREKTARAATSAEKRKKETFEKPLQTAKIGLLEEQAAASKRPKPAKKQSVAERKFSASQAFERIDATFKHSGIELVPNETGTIEGSATVEQLKPLMAKANKEGFDLVTSKGEVLDSGVLAAVLGRKARQLINFTVVPSGISQQAAPASQVSSSDRLAGLISLGSGSRPVPSQPTAQTGRLIEQLGPVEEAPARKLLKRAGAAIGEGLTGDPAASRRIRERRAARERLR